MCRRGPSRHRPAARLDTRQGTYPESTEVLPLRRSKGVVCWEDSCNGRLPALRIKDGKSICSLGIRGFDPFDRQLNHAHPAESCRPKGPQVALPPPLLTGTGGPSLPEQTSDAGGGHVPVEERVDRRRCRLQPQPRWTLHGLVLGFVHHECHTFTPVEPGSVFVRAPEIPVSRQVQNVLIH